MFNSLLEAPTQVRRGMSKEMKSFAFCDSESQLSSNISTPESSSFRRSLKCKLKAKFRPKIKRH